MFKCYKNIDLNYLDSDSHYKVMTDLNEQIIKLSNF
jgi:hypothetical protein